MNMLGLTLVQKLMWKVGKIGKNDKKFFDIFICTLMTRIIRFPVRLKIRRSFRFISEIRHWFHAARPIPDIKVFCWEKMCLNSSVAIFYCYDNIQWLHPKLPQQLSFILPLKYLHRNFAMHFWHSNFHILILCTGCWGTCPWCLPRGRN